jgi:hypothetical protein
MSTEELTMEELKTLFPFCPCRVCTQSWTSAVLGFFIHGNCRTCHGCLQSSLDFGVDYVSKETIRIASEKKNNSSSA